MTGLNGKLEIGEMPLNWTNPSVVALLEAHADRGDDPRDVVIDLARERVFDAQEEGWPGPPFDPFLLAEMLGMAVIARDELEDARLVDRDGKPMIEFNPNRRRPRVRFSVAHEIGHWLFPDYGERARYRSHSAERRDDDWQLEMLCNLAASEFLMPLGAFPDLEKQSLDINHLMDLRRAWHVSTEALLNRVVRLTPRASGLFAARRQRQTMDSPFLIDYFVGSRAWRAPLSGGELIEKSTVLNRCTAVGHTARAEEVWSQEEITVDVQCVGIPAYPGDRFPRVVGIIQPHGTSEPDALAFRYVRGDATDPVGDNSEIIAHVVNNQAERWGGYGFARALGDRFPEAATAYHEWAQTSANRTLGAVHTHDVGSNCIASMVVQSGYGPSENPRLRYGALTRALARLAALARERNASVHMPLIGTGQAGGRWSVIKELVLSELSVSGVDTTVYVLPDQPMPEEEPHQLRLTA